MGCFLACFGASKEEKNPKFAHNVPSQNPNFKNQYKPLHVPSDAVKQENPEKPINFVTDSQAKTPEKFHLGKQGKLEEQSSSNTRKKVTFDSNVKEYKDVSLDDYDGSLGQIQDIEKDVIQNSNEPVKSPSVSEGGSTLSSLGSYPPSYRYSNCQESDYDEEELDYEVNDLNESEDEHDDDEKELDFEVNEMNELDYEVNDSNENKNEYDEGGDEKELDYEVNELNEHQDKHDEDDEDKLDVVDEYYDDDLCPTVQEFSPGSFSSMESRIECPATRVVRDGHHNPMSNDLSLETVTRIAALNRSARDRSGYVHSVLNPVENTVQWKAVKAKGTSPLKHHKENFQMGQINKQSTAKFKSNLDEPKNDNDVLVDASLSTWLIASQKTPPNKATPIGLEPISSGTSLSSHGSNSVRSQEESPYEGSRLTSSFKGIPNTTSKYREDKRVNWHSTPFESRLEKALSKEAAEGNASHRVC